MASICEMSSKKAEINYPSFWEYRVIFDKNDDVNKIAAEVLKDYEYKISFSKFSSGGKYASYSMNVLVNSDAQRVEIFTNLKKYAKFIL